MFWVHTAFCDTKLTIVYVSETVFHLQCVMTISRYLLMRLCAVRMSLEIQVGWHMIMVLVILMVLSEVSGILK